MLQLSIYFIVFYDKANLKSQKEIFITVKGVSV